MSSASDVATTQDDVRSIELFISYSLEKVRAAQPSANAPSTDFYQALQALSESPLALVGAGKMGSAILESWLALGIRPEWIIVVEPKPSVDLLETANRNNIRVASHIRDIGPVSVLFLAIKPQDAESILPYFKHLIGNKTLVISIMAGKSIETIAKKLSRNSAIVRAMPNIAASVGRSATAAFANEFTESYHRKLAFALLRTTGSVVWLEDESLMDAVTAVSGSGPAYVFLLAEELAKAGIEAGLPTELATKLARDTVSGSGELLYRSNLPADVLRKKVTSPGGTTAAALEVLTSHNGLRGLLTRAVCAATLRSKELSK